MRVGRKAARDTTDKWPEHAPHTAQDTRHTHLGTPRPPPLPLNAAPVSGSMPWGWSSGCFFPGVIARESVIWGEGGDGDGEGEDDGDDGVLGGDLFVAVEAADA